jgi:hypothetical protein
VIAPAPWIWRYGSDFKDIPTLEFHCYQNTFIASRDLDKSSYVSHLFYNDPTVVSTFRNNIYLVLKTDRTLGRVPASTTALSEGNIWYRYHVNPEPLFRGPLFQSGQGRQYSTLAELHTDFPNWERSSQIADPRLENFTDEYFDSASFYPNTDFRPAAGGPAERKGVVLPANLPDDFGSAFGLPPDAGARPITAPVMAVGVDAAKLFTPRMRDACSDVYASSPFSFLPGRCTLNTVAVARIADTMCREDKPFGGEMKRGGSFFSGRHAIRFSTSWIVRVPSRRSIAIHRVSGKTVFRRASRNTLSDS